MGLTDSEVTRLLRIKDPTKQAAAAAAAIFESQESMAMADERNSPDMMVRGEDSLPVMSRAEREDMEDPLAATRGDTPTIGRDADGWNVRLPTGETIPARTPHHASALAQSWMQDEEDRRQQETSAAIDAMNTGGLETLSEYYENEGSGGRTGNSVNLDTGKRRGMLDDVEDGRLTMDEALKQVAVRNAANPGEPPLTPATARIFGRNDAEYKRGKWRDVSNIYQGGTVMDLVEENSHGWWKWARHEGSYTLDEAEQWLRGMERDTGGKETFLPPDMSGMDAAFRRIAIDEGLAKASVAWWSGKQRNSSFAPKGIRKVLMAMREYIEDVLRTAARMYKLDRDGKLEGRWKEYLAASVGLDDEEIQHRLMQDDQAAILEEVMDPDLEILQATKGKLPHPDDMDPADPLAMDLKNLAGHFQKITKRKDRMGRRLVAFGKEANAFFAKKGTGEGIKLDDVRQKLNSDYGFNFETIGELFDAIDDSLRGRPVYGVGEAISDIPEEIAFEFGRNYSLGVKYDDEHAGVPRSKAYRQRQKTREAWLAAHDPSRAVSDRQGDVESFLGDRRATTGLRKSFLGSKDKATLDAAAIIQPFLRGLKDDVGAMDLLNQALGFSDDPLTLADVLAIQGGKPSPAGLKRLLEMGADSVRTRHVENPNLVLEAFNYMLNGGGFVWADEADGVIRPPDKPRADVMLFAADDVIHQVEQREPAFRPDMLDQSVIGLAWDSLKEEFVPVEVKISPWAGSAKTGKWNVFQNASREYRIERLPGMKEAFDAMESARTVGVSAFSTSYSIKREGVGVKKIKSAPAIVRIESDPFGGFQSSNKGEWLGKWKEWEVSNRAEWRQIVILPEGQVRIGRRTAEEIGMVKHKESLAKHYQAAAMLPELLKNSRLASVEEPVGKPKAAEVHKRYAWATFPDGQRRNILLSVIRWKDENVEEDTAYSLESIEVTQKTASAHASAKLATPAAASEEIADASMLDDFTSGFKPEHRFSQNRSAYSIGRADKYTRRLVGAVEARMGDPAARAEAFTRLRTKLLAIEADFQIRAGRMGTDKAGPADYERENIARAGREVQAILGILPPEARYRVNVGGALGRVVEAKSDRGRVNALLRLVREVDEELEYYLRQAYREDLGELLKRAEAKRNDSRKISGKLGGEAHDFFDRVNQAMGMDMDDAQRLADSTEKALINETDKTRIVELAAELEVLATFGALDDPTMPANRIKAALDLARQVYDQGRMTWLTIMQDRADRVAAEAQRVVAALGDPRVTLGTKSRTRIIQWFSDGFWGEFVSIEQLMGRLAEVTGDPANVFRGLSDKLRHAMNNYEDRQLARNREMAALFADVFGTTNPLRVAAMLGALTDIKSKPGQITIRPARRVKQPAIPLERVPGILSGQYGAGTIDPATGRRLSAPMFSKADLDEIQMEYDRHLAEAKKLRQAGSPVRQRVLNWSKLVAGKADHMDIPEMEAVYHLLLWRQRDYRPALRLHGVDELTIEQMEEWISPEARQIMEWLGKRGDVEFAEIDKMHRSLYGVGLPKVDNHFRGMFEHQDKNGVAANPFGDNATGEGSGLGRAGFARHRVSHRSRPKFASALQVWQAHTAEVDWWLSHAALLTELGQIVRRPDVNDALAGSLGDQIQKAVRVRLQFLENGGAEAAGGMLLFEQTLSRMRAGASAALLGLKLSTLMVQASAALGSAVSTRMTGEAWLRGVAGLMANPSRFSTMWQSPTIRRRLEMGTSWAIRQAMQNANFHPSQFAEMARMGMVPIAWTDAAFTSISAAIAYDKGLADAKRAGMSGADAEASALDFVDAVVNETAQPVTSLNRSTIENKWLNDPVKWLAWAFATEARQKLSMTIVAARKLATGKGPGTRQDALRITAALALMRAMEFGIRQIYQEMTKPEGDDDDRWEDPKAWIHAILAGHLGGLPVLGQGADVLLAGALGQPWFSGGTPWTQGIGRSLGAAGKLAGEEELEGKEVWEAVEGILKTVGTFDARLAPLAQAVNLTSTARGIWQSSTEEGAGETALLEKLAKQQREAQKVKRLDLDKAEKELRAMPEGERWKALNDRHADDPETMRELMGRLRAPALEPDEARLRKFAVEGGFRARAIAAVIAARNLDPAATADFLDRLRAKRVLVPEMEAQLQEAMTDADN